MNVNFSVFIDKILAGEKRQTIRRASPKWKNVKAGDKLAFRMAKGGGFVVKFTK